MLSEALREKAAIAELSSHHAQRMEQSRRPSSGFLATLVTWATSSFRLVASCQEQRQGQRSNRPLSEKGSPHQHNASGSASCSVNAIDSWWVGHWGNSERMRDATHWGSWADCLEMIKIRHPDVPGGLLRGWPPVIAMFPGGGRGSQLRLIGVDTPNWEVLSAGLRPEEGRESNTGKRPDAQTWVAESGVVHEQHQEEVVWPLLSTSQRASVRSQSGPLASVPFTSFPTCRVTRMESEPFRALFLRRLRMLLLVSVRSCVCGRRLDLFGHHRAACSRAGVLSRRGFAVENAVEQICREAGARVT